VIEQRSEPGAPAEQSIAFRPGTIDDSHTVYRVFQESILDLSQRLNVMAITGGNDDEVLAQLWESRRPLFEHLARTAYRFWIAEVDGEAVGYARSILRSGVWDLTEFFVRPGFQAAGLGRELLARVLPQEEVEHKVIIASTDTPALARYLKAGVYARFPIVYFSRSPEQVELQNDLHFVPIKEDEETLQTLAALDEQVLGHRRDVEHSWLLQERQGYLYLRHGQPVGYGYTGRYSGPFALLDAADFPAVLAHAESLAAEMGDSFGVEVPLVNQAAVNYLMQRRYEMDNFYAFFMSDAPFGKFEHYIFPSPPFFL
jgi:GNAT superfamily N-acetyltransferase